MGKKTAATKRTKTATPKRSTTGKRSKARKSTKNRSPSTSSSADSGPFDERFVPLRIDQLQLDPDNPRLGLEVGGSQRAIVGKIIADFGVTDVISSIAVNGYLDAEPLVVQVQDGEYIVKEGNRRLVSLILLSEETRGAEHSKLADRYIDRWQKNGSPPIDPVPCLVVRNDAQAKDILPYLGVKHLTGAKRWDSYAKANWIARTIDETELSWEQVVEAIGDSNNTVRRLLQGFYLATQVVENDLFDPGQSNRRGNGSQSDYAFSWVYTLLGYKSAREYLDVDTDPEPNPVPTDKLDEAGEVFRFMFGQGEQSREVVRDSRELRDFARLLLNPRAVSQFRKGVSVAEVAERDRPSHIIVGDALAEIELAIGQALTEAPNLTASQAARFLSQTKKLTKQFQALRRTIEVSADDEVVDENGPEE